MIVGKKTFAIIFIVIGALTLSSCGRRTLAGYKTIPFVEKILKDTTSRDFRLVSSYQTLDHSGPIMVIGTPKEALRMTEDILTSDRFDNVDGRMVSDSLPDFAGETVYALLDQANSRYSGYFGIGNEEFLQETAVRNFLYAMDTTTLMSSYDMERKVRKPKAKVIVLASSYLSAYGYYDIDTLINMAGNKVPILATVQSMYEYAWSRHGKGIRIGIWSSPDLIGNGVYSAVLAREGDDAAGTTIQAFAPDSSEILTDRLINFLNLYRDAGNSEPLDVLLLDDPDVDIHELKAATDSIINSDGEGRRSFSKLLGKDFECVDAGTAISWQCFTLMRERNCFTHKIAYPAFKPYITVPVTNLPIDAYMDDGSLADSYKYNRAPDSGSATYISIEMNDRYVPEEITAYMQEKTPKTYSLYVR